MTRTDGNVVSPVVCVNAAGKVDPRFPSRGTIHLQKFLEITSRAKAQWRSRRAGRKNDGELTRGVEEKTESARDKERDRMYKRELNYEIAFDIRRIGTTAVNLGDDRNQTFVQRTPCRSSKDT